ncbi:MAG: TonB-dependent receptor, partial [Candidatus Binatia bacterium]
MRFRHHTWLRAFLFACVAAAPCAPPTAAEERRMEEVVVTPGRLEQRRTDVAETVSVITQRDVRQSAARTVDDLLRQVPGFSLFRRSSSLVAHPTTQGVSLRGIGPSGVSRTLVLLDGIPLNDPFGGWVYWSRVPMESVERIEVVRGGGSGVWGNAALGGVIHVLTERPRDRALRLTAQGGSRETWRVDGGVSERAGPVGVQLGGSAFDTGGYPVVQAGQRGAIDEDAASRNGSFRGRLEYEAAPGAELHLDGSFFAEDRENGTPLTRNETDIGTAGAGGRIVSADGSEWLVGA